MLDAENMSQCKDIYRDKEGNLYLKDGDIYLFICKIKLIDQYQILKDATVTGMGC